MRTETGWVGLAVVAGILALAGALAACSQSATAPPVVQGGAVGTSGASSGGSSGGTTTTTSDASTGAFCYLNSSATCVATYTAGGCSGDAGSVCPTASLSGCCVTEESGASQPSTYTCYYNLSSTQITAQESSCTALTTSSSSSAWQTSVP